MIVRFVVPGPPVTQGSMKAVKSPATGKAIIVHAKTKGNTVAKWRRAAMLEARAAMRDRPVLKGAISVEVIFYLSRPISRAKALYPDTGLDLDKLCRALGDALEGTVTNNDARICHWNAHKLYADDSENGIPQTVVTVREMLRGPVRQRGGM